MEGTTQGKSLISNRDSPLFLLLTLIFFQIMNPAFHRSMPVQRFGKIVPKFFKLVNEDGKDTPIADNMRALTLDILGQTAFGKTTF
jgi:hypothetical protein